MDAIKQFRFRYASASSAEVRTLIKEDKEFRGQLERLYERYFHRKLNKGCTSCWLDAYVLLMRYDINKLTQMADRQFELKAGALLVDVVSGANELMASHHNLTDELALYHLRTNPKCIKHFAKYPENWEELVKPAEQTADEEKPKKPRRAKKNE